ncbi:MAG: methylamine utilization protein MauG [Methylocystaceae bacterium]|nr:methylamine utilization protein MauG [Methylocystaceae bacterium]
MKVIFISSEFAMPSHLFKPLILSTCILFSGLSPAKSDDLSELGQLLFFDTALSKNETQACATCHNPEFGFTDPRDNGVSKMASLGDDDKSIGDRQAPTASYASFSPTFHKTDKGVYKGGQFWDGRAADLAEQAGGPPLNPAEMGMPDKASVIERLKENPDYIDRFTKLFGADIFKDVDLAYNKMTQAIAAYERTKEFAPFDSKYDRFLRGEVKLTGQEELGRILFFSQQFTNCNRCHQLQTLPGAENETFTNYEYHNIGVPSNTALRNVNGVGVEAIDDGLLANPGVTEKEHRGKHKVPTLRNVAVTAPYMHNGVFKDLRTVIKFYNKYNSRSPVSQINPETKQNWAPAEVPDTISEEDLKVGDALDTRKIDALVAFMETLTDARYEHLLKK